MGLREVLAMPSGRSGLALRRGMAIGGSALSLVFAGMCGLYAAISLLRPEWWIIPIVAASLGAMFVVTLAINVVRLVRTSRELHAWDTAAVEPVTQHAE